VLGRRLLGGLGLLRLLSLRLLGAERAGQPESGTEERPVGSAAALAMPWPAPSAISPAA